MNIDALKSQTIALIDRLKRTTMDNGLGNGGNEYVVIVETFLYKFLNDKFVYEAKQIEPELEDAKDVYKALNDMSDDDYEVLCDSMLDTVILKKEYLIPNLAKNQNKDNFAVLFDSTMTGIADDNESVFYIQNEDSTKISIMKPLSDLITGSVAAKNNFCKSLIGDVSTFSFEDAFGAGYDFFSTIFEYLIKDYNSNGGGTYAEYYTPLSMARMMARILVPEGSNLSNKKINDPTAGTGTLIIALGHAIGENNCTIYTQDISDKSSSMLMLNLILNNMGHSLSHVIKGNTLTHPFHRDPKDHSKLMKFDYIVMNPPFKLDFSNYQADLLADPFKGRFFAGIPNIPKKDKKGMEIYLVFFQHMLFTLADDGKAAIVVPTGFITASTGIALKIRKHLIDNKILRGVVSMPGNLFANTGTNVSVVFVDKSGVEKPILIDASKMGETIKEGKNQKTKLRDFEIDKIVETFQKAEPVDDFSVTPSFDEIKDKKYSLSAGQYFDIKIEYVDITEEEFNKRMNDYKAKLIKQFEEGHQLENEIMKQLENLKLN